MRFNVAWSDDAADQLAELWLDAKDRDAVSGAANAIDTALEDDPGTRARHLAEGLYVIWSGPLQVLFEIDDLDRAVKITAVGRRATPS